MNHIHSCLRDAGPDAWGRRLVNYQFPHLNPTEIDYFLKSGSNRIGGLDFQVSPTEYIPRDKHLEKLEIINDFAEIIEDDKPFNKKLAPLLLHGTSIGGARPKCIVDINETGYIAKFSLSTDLYSIIKAEYIAMRLAKICEVDVADVSFKTVLGRDVILVKRFDRIKNSCERRLMLSGLSLLQLNEMEARYASYQNLADLIRQQFSTPKETLIELFKRLVFNIIVGNTDDHARNHSAFWDGKALQLTPALDPLKDQIKKIEDEERKRCQYESCSDDVTGDPKRFRRQ